MNHTLTDQDAAERVAGQQRENEMKLFLISQTQNDDYDTYDSAVVAAPDEETARNMNPADGLQLEDWDLNYNSWCSGPEHVTVRYLGEAVEVERGVVCASFNAG